MKFLLICLYFIFLSFVKPIALPTPAQLAYQDAEIGAIIHFSSNTFAETQGCGPDNWHLANDSNIFQPNELDVDSWLQAAANFGASSYS